MSSGEGEWLHRA